MFSLWALYIKTSSGTHSIETDNKTSIAYEWYSPYFNEQHAASWDFTVPRTPYNESLLLRAHNETDVITPLNESEFTAYFRGLPWHEENEIDEGVLTVVRIAEWRITLQFRQYCSLLEALRNKHNTRSYSLDGPFASSPTSDAKRVYPYFICFAETLRATGIPIHPNSTSEQRAIVGISYLAFLRLLLPSLKCHQDLSSDLEKIYLIPSSPNFKGVIQHYSNSPTPITFTLNTQYAPVASSVNTRVIEASPIASEYRLKGTLRLHGELSAYELLNEVLASLCLRLCIRSYLEKDSDRILYTAEIIVPDTEGWDYAASKVFNTLSSYHRLKISIPYLKDDAEEVVNLQANYTPYIALPLAAMSESDTLSRRFRYYNREQLLQFHPPIEHGANLYASTKNKATPRWYRKEPNPVKFARHPLNTSDHYTESYEETWPHKTWPPLYFTLTKEEEDNVHCPAFIPGGSLRTKTGADPYITSKLCVNLDNDIYKLENERWEYVGHEPYLSRYETQHIPYKELKLLRGRVILAPCFPAQELPLYFDTLRPQSYGVNVRYYERNGRWGGYGLFIDQRAEENDTANAWRWLPYVNKTHSIKTTFMSNFFNSIPYHPNPGRDPDLPIHPRPGLGDNFDLLSLHPPTTSNILLDRYGDQLTSVHYRNTHEKNTELFNEEIPYNYKEAPTVYNKVMCSVHVSPCVHALDIQKETNNQGAQFYVRGIAQHPCTSTDWLYFRTVKDNEENIHPLFTCEGNVNRLSLTKSMTRILSDYAIYYRATLSTAMEGELSRYEEEDIFKNLYLFPFPTPDTKRIGQQRIKKLSLTIRPYECAIRTVTVIQFNDFTAIDEDRF